jgi:hypothetical protein
MRIRVFRAAGFALLLAAALVSSTAAQPTAGETKEVVFPLPPQVVLLPAAECGLTTIVRGDGSTVQVPRQGRFTRRCSSVTVVDASNKVLSRFTRCEPPVFMSC